jgi:hypothetical protein
MMTTMPMLPCSKYAPLNMRIHHVFGRETPCLLAWLAFLNAYFSSTRSLVCWFDLMRPLPARLCWPPVLVRLHCCHHQIDLRWPLTPIGDMKYDGWSVRFTGLVQPSYTELYKLIVTSDDGVRLWVDGDLCINEWDAGSSINFCFVDLMSGPCKHWLMMFHRRAGTPCVCACHSGVSSVCKVTRTCVCVLFIAGRYHDFVLEYHDTVDDAWLKLEWESISQEKEVIPSTAMFHFEDVVGSPYNVSIEPSQTYPQACVIYGNEVEMVRRVCLLPKPATAFCAPQIPPALVLGLRIADRWRPLSSADQTR